MSRSAPLGSVVVFHRRRGKEKLCTALAHRLWLRAVCILNIHWNGDTLTILDCALFLDSEFTTLRKSEAEAMHAIPPWIGQGYSRGISGRRLFLLGESNYCPTGDSTDIVRENISAWLREKPAPFFTKAARLVLKATEVPHDRREHIQDLWRHVAFTNYVPRVLRKARERPSPEDWVSGRPVLLELLAELRPDIVIVLGTVLRSHLGWLDEQAQGSAIVATAHPSSFGFKYADNVPLVMQAFQQREPRDPAVPRVSVGKT